MKISTLNLKGDCSLIPIFKYSNQGRAVFKCISNFESLPKQSSTFKRVFLLVLMNFLLVGVFAQVDIYQLMQREDLKLDEIETIANDHFQKVGTKRGTGYKQYQRWLNEQKFHIDDQGNFIQLSVENELFQKYLSDQKMHKATTSVWKELGPNSWSPTTSWNPGIGRITSVAIDPTDTTVLYVSSPGGGLWKSTNSGINWIPLLDYTFNAYMFISHVCIDPSNRNTLYACLTSGGVIKSTNAGATWTNTTSGPSNPKKVIITPGNSNIIFATAANGILRSTNGGASWTQTCTVPVEDIEFNPYNPNIMYASGSSSSGTIWRSTNAGLNWTVVGSTNGITGTGRTLLAVSTENAAIVYAIQANGSAFGKIYRSADSGSTFSTLITGNPSNGTNFFGYDSDGTGTGGQATYDMAICANPKNASEVHIAGIICWKSTNGGTSFVAETEWYYPNPTGYNHADVHALEYVNNTIYSGSDGGIYKSTNRGNDWIDLSKGIGIRQVYRISCSKTNTNVIGSGSQDNGSSMRQSTGQWKDWIGADGMDNVISPTNSSIAYTTIYNGYIYKTTDGGNSYTSLNTPSTGNWITPLVMHPTHHDTLYVGWQGVWRSNNARSSWSKISGSYISGYMNYLAVAPSNTKYIYGAIGSVLYRTSNGGTTWSSVNLPANITSICVSPTNPQKIWLAFNSTSIRIYISTDMGDNFTNLSSGLPNMSARSIAIDDNNSECVYLGMNIGVYFMDKNTPWTLLATGLPLVAINDIKIQKSGGKLRIGTYGRGVWETDLQNLDACNPPTGLNSTAITTNNATINWTTVAGAINYYFEYKEESSSTWNSGITTSSNNYTLTGLNSGKNYDWRVKTNCNYGTSIFSNSKVTTQCNEPIGLVASGITYNSADIAWQPVPGAVDYTVQYRINNTNTWIGSTVTGLAFITLTNLRAGTKYEWQVKTNCTNANSSYLSSFLNTLCIEPSNPISFNTSGSSNLLTWLPVDGAVNYNCEYKAKSENTWKSTTTTDSFVNLNNLQTGLYDWRVSTNCAEGSQGYLTSEFLTYCISSGTIQDYEFIRLINVGSLNRISGSDNGLYSSPNVQTILIPGATYLLSFAAGFPANSIKNTRQDYWRFFIDYNRNGYVYDNNELVGSRFTTDTGIYTIKFTVPNNVNLGKTLLRASLKMGSYQNPCNAIKFGEVEDYYIELTNAPMNAVPKTFGAGITDFNISPVPVFQNLNLAYSLGENTKNLNISLSDAVGKTYFESQQSKQKGSHSEIIDVSKLKYGVYFVTIKTDKSMNVKKVFISN